MFLLIIEPPSGGRFEHRLEEGSYVLGREDGICDVVFASPEVSRQHVRLTLKDGLCTVEDLGSTSGTFHSGQPITEPASLGCPFEIHLGTVRVSVAVAEGGGEAGTTIIGESGVPQSSSSTGATSTHYIPGREIGKGGMGSVLEANDQLLGRTVAMKVIRSSTGDSEGMRLRFIREATVLARLEHPNIVPIHEMGKDSQGRLFYTMKKVEGRTLQAILDDLSDGDAATVNEFTLDRLLNIFRKVCDAMAFAHAKGVIHRDLKPENIMVGKFGEVLVMDWGLAKVLHDVAQLAAEIQQLKEASSPQIEDTAGTQLPTGFQELTDSQLRGSSQNLTMDGAVMGSPQYMPPEQAEGKVAELDERSDIFSLGGILYSILTLRAPVEGRTVAEVLENVKSGNILSPTQFNTGSSSTGSNKLPKGSVKDPRLITPLPHCPGGKVPSGLSAVSMKALAADPDRRYPDVRELSADVEAFQRGYGTSAEALTALGHAALFVKRHKGISIAAAVSISLIALLTAGFVWKVLAEKKKAEQAGEQAFQEKTNALFQAEIAGTATAEALKNLARSRLTQADQAYQLKNWPETRRHLDDLGEPPPELKTDRDYLARQLDQSLKPETPYPPAVWNVAPDPSRPGVFAMPSQNGFVDFINLETGARVSRVEKSGDYKTPAVSPDGTHLGLAGTNGKGISVHETASGKRLTWFDTPQEGLRAFSFNADGTRLFLASSKGVTAYDLSGNLVWQWQGSVQAAHANPEGHPLVVANQEAIHLLDPATGKVLKKLPAAAYPIRFICLSPDGSRLVYTETMGGCFGLDAVTGEPRFQSILGRRYPIDLQFLPDNEFFIAAFALPGQEDTFYVEAFSANTGTWVRTFSGGVSQPRNLAVHPRTGHIASSGDRVNGWGPGVLKALVTVGIDRNSKMPGNAWGFLDETQILFRSPYRGKVSLVSLESFETTDPNVLFPNRDLEDAFHFDLSPDRSHLLAIQAARAGMTNTVARVYRKSGSQWTLKNEIPFLWRGAQAPHLLRLAPDASAFLEANFYLSRIHALNGSPDPVILAHDHNRCYIIDAFWLDRGKALLGAHYGTQTRGRSDAIEFLRRWNPITGASTAALRNPTVIHAVAMDPGETRFAEAGLGREIRIRNAATLEVIREFRAHDAPIRALSWHPSQPIIASASLDRSIRFWDADTGELVDELYGISADPQAMKFGPKGNWLALSSDDPEFQLRVWETTEIGTGPPLLRRTTFLKQKTESIETFTLQTPKLFTEAADKEVLDRLTRGESVDLVPFMQDPESGPWRVRDGALVSNPKARLPILLLPALLDRMQAYTIRIRLQAIAPNEAFTVNLPIGQSSVAYSINSYAWAGYSSGLRILDGQFRPVGEHARQGKLISDEEVHELFLRVERPDGQDQIHISVDLDGGNLQDWEGARRRLTPTETFKNEDPGRLAFVCYKQGWRIKSVEIQGQPLP